ncbi:F0F1 ATP synthase subunit B [Humibacter albus]|jgi:F-type H+-transporting ATPase subunit b|uniref:F0F1 ATP synthase subunit B n=1 Tax=Humibacter albus TaxID=427754 RepID=UPI0003B5CDA9|nr:F0F1 ATP synthase subunit B [Humibacter albus]
MIHAIVVAEEAPNPLIPSASDLVWSALCFVVILIFFWKLALPRMKKMLDERAEAIEGNIAKADEAQHQAEALLEEYTAQLADARSEAAHIREQAREDGKRIVAEHKDQATSEADRITRNAQVQIDAEKKAAAVALRAEVGSLAIDLASGVIGESLKDSTTATGVVDRFLAELEQDDKAGSKA